MRGHETPENHPLTILKGFSTVSEEVLRKGVEKYPRFLQDRGIGVRSQIVVEEDSAQMVSDIIRALKSLRVSEKNKSELEGAIEHMEGVQRRAVVTAGDMQRNIDDIMEALDSLLSITSADISQIRLMTDALLEVWIGKLILFPSS